MAIAIREDVSKRMPPWKLEASRIVHVTGENSIYGHGSSCCILWEEEIHIGDNHQAIEASFETNDYATGAPAYLLIYTRHAQYPYNDVYINHHYIGSLVQRGLTGVYLEPFAIPALRKGDNVLHVVARDIIGGQAMSGSHVIGEYVGLTEYPNIDNVILSGARVVYPATG